MARYFIEVAYKGTLYGGFQIQRNATTIQSEVTRSLEIFYKSSFELTGASRTDAGVHALQNYFHFDTSINEIATAHIYNLNAILPDDIVIKKIFLVSDQSHCRFDATNRSYEYFVYQEKDPFVKDTAFFYPYPLQLSLLNEAAKMLLEYTDFTTFSKKNSQVNNFNCKIFSSKWVIRDSMIVYEVTANRFLRGMVRGLVGTMLRVGSGKVSPGQFEKIINSLDCSNADFSVPAHGLFLKNVHLPEVANK